MPPVPEPTLTNQEKPKLSQNTVEYWIKIVVGLCFIVLSVNVFLFFFYPKFVNKKTDNQSVVAPISGTIDLNGYIPAGSTIDIQKRLPGTEDFVIAQSGVTAADGASWVWDGARIGQPYEFKAVLISGTTVLSESPIKTVAAPATDETLRIVSSATPPAVTAGTTTTGTPDSSQQTAVISGKLDLNGYIPPNATVTIQAKKSKDTTVIIIGTMKANDSAAWVWNGAMLGVTYELQANLINGSTTIGTSPTLTVAAPAQNEILSINSKAQSPTVNESISGVFDINGFIPPNATVAIAVRKSGTAQFTNVLSGLPSVNNTTWNIPNLQSGVSYDILAYLQVNNQNFAQSQLLVVPAPAHNETLIINSQNRPPGPSSSTMAIGCVGKGGTNQWQASIAFNKSTVDQNVKQFIVQVGTTGGDSSLVNNQIAPGNPTQPQNYTTNYIFNEGQTYYVQYAYSTCANCTDVNFFSQFSPPVSFSCATQPTPTITPVPSATPYPTYTPYPTNTQPPLPTNTMTPTNTPQPTPKIAQCDQSCGGSTGFICVDALTCVNPAGAIGGDVCRNPNCTDKTDCTCN